MGLSTNLVKMMSEHHLNHVYSRINLPYDKLLRAQDIKFLKIHDGIFLADICTEKSKRWKDARYLGKEHEKEKEERERFLMILNQISWKRAALEPYHNSVSTIRIELEAYLLLSWVLKSIGIILGHVFHFFDRDKHIFNQFAETYSPLIDVSWIHASTFWALRFLGPHFNLWSTCPSIIETYTIITQDPCQTNSTLGEIFCPSSWV